MDLLYFFERIRTPFFTKLFEMFTFFGEEIAIIAVISLIYWCISKKLAYRITFAYFTSGLLVQGLKITFRVPRPWVIDPNFKPVASVVDTATGYSFPSGHTQGSTALYGTLAAYTKRRWLKAVCCVIFLGVAVSRMYLGVHTPYDVGVSLLITLIGVITINKLAQHQFTQKSRRYTLIGMMVFCIALLTYSLSLKSAGIIELKYALDSCNAASAGMALTIGWYIESQHIHFSTHTKSKAMQAIKYLIGIGITVAIKMGFKPLVDDTILGEGLLNFVLVLWIMVGYPLVIKRVFEKDE